jgi:cytochrome P450
VHVARLLEEAARQPSFDWMAQVAAPFSLRLTADLLGVPEPDLDEYVPISEGIALRMDAGLVPANIAVGDAARVKLNALGRTWFEGPRSPGSLLGEIERGAADTDIPVHYVENSAAMMFNASYGTVYATCGNVAGLVAADPDLLARLGGEGVLATAVDELVRFDGPAQGTTRVSLVDIEIAGTPVAPGDLVLTLLAAANRDPRQFDRPDELVLDRRPNRHLGFGWGPHSCLGSMFGQVSIEALLRALLSLPGRLAPAATPTRRRTATVRSYETLPVRIAGVS